MRMGDCANQEMHTKRTTLSWPRVAVLAWASLWMLVAPLFHIHPEADHRHGEIGHVHGGTIHTAWSPDLDCEFDRHRQVDPTEESAKGKAGNFAQFSHLGDSHTEFTLSLLNDSTDRKSLKPVVAQALGLSSAADSDVERSVRMVWNTASVQLSVPYIYAIAPRAPPSLLI
jgi:hypothetical protein